MKKPNKKMEGGGYTPLFKRPKPSTGATPTQTKEGYKPLVNKVKDRVKESIESIGSDTGYKPLIRRTKPSTGATPTGSKEGYTPLIGRSGSRGEKPASPASKPATSIKRNDGLEDYMKTVEGESHKIKEKKTPTKVAGKSVAKKRAAFNLDKRDAVISSTRPTLTVKKPTAPGVSTAKPASREYTPAEIKIMQTIKKGKTKIGTVKPGAQAKIANIRKRADAINKRAAMKSAKSSVRKSFRK